MREKGIDAHYGHWITPGMPRVILLNPYSQAEQMETYLQQYVANHRLPDQGKEMGLMISFGRIVELFFNELLQIKPEQDEIVAHFHEYAASTAILETKRQQLQIATVFTTHATVLGRALAKRDELFYQQLPYYHWQQEAATYDSDNKFLMHLERAIAQAAEVFTTVSEVMVGECFYLLGRKPTMVIPNGVDMKSNGSFHSRAHREQLKESVRKHFEGFYDFDLSDTLFFFTAGRYEFVNKGYDIIIKALGKLNRKMQAEKIEKHVVMFFVTDATDSENEVISAQHQSRFDSQFQHQPHILTKCRSKVNITSNEIVVNLLLCGLNNEQSNKVKVLYHPEFITKSSLFLSTSYQHFTHGCHLGIFPSKYEPWGYTPHESIINGIPTVTSNLSGFGQYVLENVPNPEQSGIKVLDRKKNTTHAIDQLAHYLLNFVRRTQDAIEAPPNLIGSSLMQTDWVNFIELYKRAYHIALQSVAENLVAPKGKESSTDRSVPEVSSLAVQRKS